MTQQLPDRDTMLRAFTERDPSFEGVFFTGVLTTGIFCRPTCRARKPRPENVIFFQSSRAAIAHGFRPCKLCRPMDAGEDPAWVRRLLQELEEAEGNVLRDGDLRELGFDPARVRRWFKKHHGMTFQSFARQQRIARAYGTIRHEGSVTEAAFANGFESLSGFAARFTSSTGFAPSESGDRDLIIITRITTPLGPLVAAAVEGRICLLEFADRPMLETQLDRIQRAFKAPVIAGKHVVFAQLHDELSEYFAGRRTSFTVPIVTRGTAFQESVWKALREVPYGTTSSYANQARAIGRPEAIRAVARANGDNRIAIIIPCHRIIGSDGSLTGYGGGIWRKQHLLQLEQSSHKSV